jgi:hypothetical protein
MGQISEDRGHRTAEYRRKRKLHHSKFLVRYSIFKIGKIFRVEASGCWFLAAAEGCPSVVSG